jgi:DNA-binding MarR family transcriptional regulator
MKHTQHITRAHTPAGKALTDFILEVFRLHGLLLAAGDRLMHPLGLSSARWQVLGAIQLTGEPLPVAHIARQMCLTRQSVQRTVDLLAQEGLIAFVDNPYHRRAKLVDFTPRGRRIMEEVNQIQTTWANDLAQGLSAQGLHEALQLLEALRLRLDAQV